MVNLEDRSPVIEMQVSKSNEKMLQDCHVNETPVLEEKVDHVQDVEEADLSEESGNKVEKIFNEPFSIRPAIEQTVEMLQNPSAIYVPDNTILRRVSKADDEVLDIRLKWSEGEKEDAKISCQSEGFTAMKRKRGRKPKPEKMKLKESKVVALSRRSTRLNQ
ncbi:OLC1v1000918C1 [Oldenlandia corymbosa var. corymbosa]|uniref:OLC1v1000918C1 n=1 Tax=Oldenlandia corymbosa var. corymbosa TaxID=529605 RepID=A0AAV1D5P1_OLDCO|nr:OLC1v1000918C1 [Oldenlandia corymbosa var. corymbosa]